jgi:hypothetical protein
MKYCLIFVVTWSFLLFAISLLLSSQSGFYTFTIPFILLSFCTFVVGICGLAIQNKRSAFFVSSLIILALLIIPYSIAVSQWPPDDDGIGIGWSFILGGGVLLALLFAFFVLMHYVAKKLRIRQL